MIRTPLTTDICGQLIFLGTGTSLGVPALGCDCATCQSTNPKNNRTRCSIILGLPDGNLLVDTPPELRMQLLREKIGVVHSVLYTHAHADHLHGIDDVRLFPYYIDRPVNVYCEKPVEDRIRKSFDYAFDPSIKPHTEGSLPRIEFIPIALKPFQALGLPITPLRLHHGNMDVLGFRFGKIAYCTDTNDIPPESEQLLKDLDVLILDCLRPDPHPTHFHLEGAMEMAKKLNAKRTIFTHISCKLEHEETNALLPKGMELAYDGMRIPLTTSLQIHQ